MEASCQKVVCSFAKEISRITMNYQQPTEPLTIPDFCTFRTEHFCSKIAEIVKCHRATVYRERARHSIDGRYYATRAHSLAPGKCKECPQVQNYPTGLT